MDMVYSKICNMFSAYVLVKIEMEMEEDGGVIVPYLVIKGEHITTFIIYVARYIISKRRGIAY